MPSKAAEMREEIAAAKPIGPKRFIREQMGLPGFRKDKVSFIVPAGCCVKGFASGDFVEAVVEVKISKIKKKGSMN